MAKVLNLGSAIDATAAAAQTGILTVETPFVNGVNCVANIILTGATGTGVAKVQVSDDNTTWTDALVTSGVLRSHFTGDITLKKYVRLNVTSVFSAGRVEAFLTDGIGG